MSPSRRRTLAPRAAQQAAATAEPPRIVAVLDIGAAAIRLVVGEAVPGRPIQILEDVERGVLLGKDTFSNGRLGVATVEATLKALEGFRRIMDSYGVASYRAVATSAVREAQNRDIFLDRVRLRTGIDVEVIDGSEENRLTYLAVWERLRDHEALQSGRAILVEVGGGSADISFLRNGEPTHSGTYALGAIRMRQNLVAWSGSHSQQTRLLRRHIHNVVEDIKSEMSLGKARHFVALGGDVRLAAVQILGEERAGQHLWVLGREPFVAFCDAITGEDVDDLVERFHLSQADAETLVPALLAYRELLLETRAEQVTIPDASLRGGLLIDVTHGEEGLPAGAFRKQVLASAAALGEKYRYNATHAQHVARLATEIFDALRDEHGLGERERLLLEVAALLHDIGLYISLRGHHKHAQYVLSVSQIFGLSHDDMAIVGNVARYHRRAAPQKSHFPYMALDAAARVVVNKLAAILRVANALDADHVQKVERVGVVTEGDAMVLQLEGAGELTMERASALHRADLMSEVFGRRVVIRETGRRE